MYIYIFINICVYYQEECHRGGGATGAMVILKFLNTNNFFNMNFNFFNFLYIDN